MSLGWIYNLQQYSGLLFQVCIDITRKKKTVPDVFAAGGRYDDLVSDLSKFEPPRGKTNNVVS